jgi:hypothetical protein
MTNSPASLPGLGQPRRIDDERVAVLHHQQQRHFLGAECRDGASLDGGRHDGCGQDGCVLTESGNPWRSTIAMIFEQAPQ